MDFWFILSSKGHSLCPRAVAFLELHRISPLRSFFFILSWLLLVMFMFVLLSPHWAAYFLMNGTLYALGINRVHGNL